MNTNFNKNFEKLHVTGLSGLFDIYGGFTFLKRIAFCLTLIITIIFSIILYTQNQDNDFLLLTIDKTVNVGFGIIAALLGLSLAGLVLIVSFGNMTLLKALVRGNIKKAIKDNSDIGFSSYQTIIAKFTFAVFVQVTTLIFLILIYFFKILEIELIYLDLVYYINFITLSLIFFSILYSLILLGHMVINIFTIAQMNHMVIFKEVIDDFSVDEDIKES